ncbi:MAG TPA: ABC transporter permease [Frankiaceae bacterium]|nr:ABC transporter permease [Frankiaceae bacterium]
MAWYAARRLLASVPVVLASTFVVFLMVTYSGDPLGDFKTQQLRQNNNPAIRADRIRGEQHFLRLDHPLLERYWLWIKGIVLHGDFGPSRHVPDIGAELGNRLLVTARLVTLAMLLAVVLALVVGVVSAVRRARVTDHLLTLVSVVFLSLPVFWFAVLLKDYLAVDLNTSLGRRLLFTMGESTPNLAGGFWTQLGDALGHLVLPTLVLALSVYPPWSRFQRTSMVEVLDSDYVRLARAKGLPRRRVLVHHALRTALIPLATVVAVDFAGLVGSTVITEQIFTWQGMGTMLLDGIKDRDVYVVLAWLLVVAVVVVVVNLISDLLYAVLDPRIRVG